jgi:hypothetical protein
MATVSDRPATVKPVSGTCQWVRRITDGSTGVLLINGRPYGVIVLQGGYRLVKPDGMTYDIDSESWSCTCPYLQRECKHAKALRAALAK